MGRYYWSKKATVEESLDLSVYDLKRRGMLTGHAAAEITWVSSHSGKESTVLVVVEIMDEPHVIFAYTVKDRDGQEKDYGRKISLTTTPCNYGGERYWFECPSCGRRVGVLYLAPGEVYFLCRRCNNLTYRSRNRSGMESLGHTSRQVEKLRSEIKRWTWRGRPTRKVRRLQVLERKMGILSGPIMARMEKFTARLR
jgi:hypothetical protein